MFFRRRKTDSGFTLLELMLAITILSAVTVVMYMTLSVIAGAWRRTVVLSENLSHGDFVMDQLVMGLRSAYYPEAALDPQYGFIHIDDGEGPEADDSISWVKLGASVVGKNCAFAGTPHRIEISMMEDEKGRGIAFKAWRIQGQPEDFDPEDIEPEIFSRRVKGFNVRTGIARKEEGVDWQDQWDHTNRVPVVLELVLYMDPREEGGDPVEIKRICPVPCSYISWKR